jgi:hypothetical protein
MANTSDQEQRIYHIVEAAFRNEEALAKAIADLKALHVDVKRTTDNIPTLVDSRVRSILTTVVETAARDIVAKFSEAEQKAALLCDFYDQMFRSRYLHLIGAVILCGGGISLITLFGSRYIPHW